MLKHHNIAAKAPARVVLLGANGFVHQGFCRFVMVIVLSAQPPDRSSPVDAPPPRR